MITLINNNAFKFFDRILVTKKVSAFWHEAYSGNDDKHQGHFSIFIICAGMQYHGIVDSLDEVLMTIRDLTFAVNLAY